MAFDPVTAVSNVAGKVVDAFTAGQRRREAQDAVKGKIQLAKQAGDQQVTITDAEWESLSIEQDSWKDEYVTIVITAPIVMILLGGVYASFTGDMRVLEGTKQALQTLGEIGIDMGEMMVAVVFAAIGLKLWRSR